MANIFWTPAEDKILTGMRAKGDSFGLIAHFMGKSRNACLGRALRLDLPKLDKPVAFKARVDERPRSTRGSRLNKIKQARARRDDNTLEPYVPAPITLGDFLGLTFDELKKGHCRYPQGNGPYLFCGQPVVPDTSWCPRCARIVYQPAAAA